MFIVFITVAVIVIVSMLLVFLVLFLLDLVFRYSLLNPVDYFIGLILVFLSKEVLPGARFVFDFFDPVSLGI